MQRTAVVAGAAPREHYESPGHGGALSSSRRRVYRWRCVAVSRKTLVGSLSLSCVTLCVPTLAERASCAPAFQKLRSSRQSCSPPPRQAVYPPLVLAGAQTETELGLSCFSWLTARRRLLAALLANHLCRCWAPSAPLSFKRQTGGSGMSLSYVPARLNEAAIRHSCEPEPGSSKSVLVTGAAGFVGFHAALALRREGWGVVGLDNFNAYYSVALKRARTVQLEAAGVHTVSADLNDGPTLRRLFALCPVSHVLHLAAQAGVRYAVKNPGAYVHSNVAGFVSLLESMKGLSPVPPLVYASSSSIYGLNDKVPFAEADRTDRPASLYAATKKSNELLAHTYAHIYGLSATGLRFFTVYGPWGRPDMAAFSFSRAIRAGTPVRIFQGPGGSELSRDFTYVDDIVAGVLAALRTAAPSGKPAPPPRLFNLGNTRPVNVSYFVSLLERRLGAHAVRQYVAVPGTGDVLFTSADVSAAQQALGYAPQVELEEGLGRFAEWFTEYYGGGEHKADMEQTFARRRLAEAGEGEGEGWLGDGEGPEGEWAQGAGQ